MAAHVTSVTFKASVDSCDTERVYAHATHASVHALIEDQFAGDNIEVDFDDGTTQQYMLDNAEIVPAARQASQAKPAQLPKGKKHPTEWLKVHVKPGVVS
jgi:hypothetical protein